MKKVELDEENNEIVIEVRLKRSELASLHDCVLDATGMSLPDDELMKIVQHEQFPLGDVISWGMSDTPTMDEVHELITSGRIPVSRVS